MERRSFLKKTAVGAAAGAIAAPVLAQATPTLNWRLASSFPKSLPILFGAAEQFAARVKSLTEGKFNIRIFAAGEIVPGTQVLDAVQAGTVEMGHTASYYYFGKDPTLAFDTAVPFGLTSRQQSAWMLHGNGMVLALALSIAAGAVFFKQVECRRMGNRTGLVLSAGFMAIGLLS